MSTKAKFQATKGTRDLLPPETALWNRVEQTAHEVFGTFGFGEIRQPIFEATDLFARSIGLDTDVVSKEMYSFADHPARTLEAFKHDISRRRLEHNSSSVLRMDVAVREFLRVLVEAEESGEVPGTAENLAA